MTDFSLLYYQSFVTGYTIHIVYRHYQLPLLSQCLNVTYKRRDFELNDIFISLLSNASASSHTNQPRTGNGRGPCIEDRKVVSRCYRRNQEVFYSIVVELPLGGRPRMNFTFCTLHFGGSPITTSSQVRTVQKFKIFHSYVVSIVKFRF